MSKRFLVLVLAFSLVFGTSTVSLAAPANTNQQEVVIIDNIVIIQIIPISMQEYQKRIYVPQKEYLNFANYCETQGLNRSAYMPNNVPIEQWQGKQFLILNLSKEAQAQGFSNIYFANSGKALPASYALRQVTVNDVAAINDPAFNYKVYMTDNSTGEQYVGMAMRGAVDGLAPIGDMQKARDVFVGGTVYARSTSVLSAGQGANWSNPDYLNSVFGQAMKVVDVWPGMQSSMPFYLVVELNGKKGVVPFSYSWTNIQTNQWQDYPAWSQSFFVRNPANFTDWSTSVLKQINNGEANLGMTEQQIYYSWGPAQSVMDAIGSNGKVYTIMDYGNQKLTFLNNKLVKIS